MPGDPPRSRLVASPCAPPGVTTSSSRTTTPAGVLSDQLEGANRCRDAIDPSLVQFAALTASLGGDR